jgi:PAS domain S-box-containing protein
MSLPRFRRWFDDPRRSPRRIALIYLAVSAVWILVSDRLLALVVSNPNALTVLQTAKGWLFVGLTAALLYLLVAESVAALQRREQWSRALVEQAQDVVLVLDQAMVVRYASPSAREVIGLDADALKGTRLSNLAHPDDVPAFGHTWRELTATAGARARFDCRCKRDTDGSWHVLEIVARNLTADAAVEGIVVHARDITERRQLEHQLSRVEHLEALGQLAAGIAHDFNNVLSVVLANAELVRREVASPVPERGELLDDVVSAARGGAQMVAKLLGFSRQAAIVRVPRQLRPIVEDIVGLAKRLIPETIDIQLETGNDPGGVRVDATAIQQILLNLITNARDAMPHGGSIRIGLHEVELDAAYAATHPWTRPGRYVRLAVADTGLGMDEATKARAFEPFFTTKPAGVGTGLGLAMAYGLVKQHQGSIEIESTPGEGTTVRLYLPVAEVGEEPVVEEAAESPGSAGKQAGTILLVEDDQALLRTARRALEAFGYSVVTATNGEEALRILETRARDFDLVISDVVLPKMGGRDLYREARERGLKARFLFASGYAARQALGDLETDPEVRFLRKPWTLEELQAAIRQTLAA